jgi:hypothetical protein
MKNDAFNGTGAFTYPDGRVYRGLFKDGAPHGTGVMTHPDGREEKVEFYKGELVEGPGGQP